MNKKPRWRKMKKSETAGTEALLQLQERRCMNACNRYLKRDPAKDSVWTLRDINGDLCAVIVHAKQNLLPVLSGQKKIPPPHFLRTHFLQNLFGTASVHSVQGPKEYAVILETALEKLGLIAAENIDYDTMCIDRPPSGFHSSGPAGLVIRRPEHTDMDTLVALHAAYEREEVLPANSEFNAAVSRLNTERIFKNEQMLVAELDGRVVGKINTNAVTFTRYQIGGVYVHPDYRGRGIARRMAGEFTASLISSASKEAVASKEASASKEAEGRGISLFVKKTNPAARNVYLGIGFEILEDYRISYY
jgi:ribosomal protein S18 acetylase RimI-like enzyme